MLAIVETGGKQYELQEGRYIDIELLDAKQDDVVILDKVVMIVASDGTKVGQPYVEDASIKARVLKHDKDKKVIVYKQRCKKGYRKKQGHRQQFTRIMVESIDFPGKEDVLSVVKEEKPVKEKATKVKKPASKAGKSESAKSTTVKKAAKPTGEVVDKVEKAEKTEKAEKETVVEKKETKTTKTKSSKQAEEINEEKSEEVKTEE